MPLAPLSAQFASLPSCLTLRYVDRTTKLTPPTVTSLTSPMPAMAIPTAPTPATAMAIPATMPAMIPDTVRAMETPTAMTTTSTTATAPMLAMLTTTKLHLDLSDLKKKLACLATTSPSRATTTTTITVQNRGANTPMIVTTTAGHGSSPSYLSALFIYTNGMLRGIRLLTLTPSI